MFNSKKIFESFMNYLHENKTRKTFSEYLVENLGAFFANVKALFSGVKLFERLDDLQKRLEVIEAQNNSNKSDILNGIENLKQSLSNDCKKSQEEIRSEIQILGKNIAEELSILDESTRMLLVASVLDNMERK